MRKLILVISCIGSFSFYSNAQTTTLTAYEKANIEQYIGIGKEIGLSEENLRTLYRNGEYKKIETIVMDKLKQQPGYKIIDIQDRLLETAEQMENLKVEKDYETDAYRTYYESDFYNMQQSISKFYNQWKLKGEYEKTGDYENRMKNELEVLNDRIATAIDNINYAEVKAIPLDYDPDTEIMNFKFTNNKGATWIGYAKMPPTAAKYLREEKRYKLLTSMDNPAKNGNETPLMFAYFNLVPSKLNAIKIDEKAYDLVITKFPLGLSNGSNQFTNKNLEINSPVFKGYSLNDYYSVMLTNKAKKEQDDYIDNLIMYLNNFDSESRSYGSSYWDRSENFTRYKNYIRKVDSLYAIKPTHSGILKSKELLKTIQSNALKSIADKGNSYLHQAKLSKDQLNSSNSKYYLDDYIKNLDKAYNTYNNLLLFEPNENVNKLLADIKEEKEKTIKKQKTKNTINSFLK